MNLECSGRLSGDRSAKGGGVAAAVQIVKYMLKVKKEVIRQRANHGGAASEDDEPAADCER